MADTLLDVVNEKDEVVGQEMRSIIHKNGLRHREVHIWYITPKKEIVFQKRSMSKDVYPGLLTLAVGGHVESGSTYEQTALIEAGEETGLTLLQDDLHYLASRHCDKVDPVTNSNDNAIQKIFGYVLRQPIDILKVEASDSQGYVVFPWDKIANPSPEFCKQFEPNMLTAEFRLIRDKLEKLVA